MTYRSEDAGKSRVTGNLPDTLSALPTRRERLRAGFMLVALFSLAAAFWIAVFRLAGMV